MIEQISIQSLCSKHTNLTSADVQMIDDLSKTLQYTADLAQANVFIDCPTNHPHEAIVVAEAAPSTVPTLYSDRVVGKFAYESLEPAVFFTHQTGKPATRKRAVTQEGKFVKQSVVPIKNADNQTIGSLIMEQDISEQIDNEEQLKALSQTTEQLTETLIGLTEHDSIISDMIQESLFLLKPDNVIVYANSCAKNLIAKKSGATEVIGTPIENHLPFLQEIDFQAKAFPIKEVSSGDQVLEVKRIYLGQHRKLSGYLLIIRDLTELREKERELMVKSTVIKEIHHRVKNNLQTVASLLSLQMKRGVPKESRKYFQESINRILSIAAAHDELLVDSNLDEVDMGQLLRRIGQMLIRNREDPETSISLKFKGESTIIQSAKAISLALVINELVQNCVKHAFVGQSCGEIHIQFQNTTGLFEVLVLDNGVGYTPSKQSCLGLDIVNSIVTHNLSGRFSIGPLEQGTKATVTFPVE